MKLLSMLLLGGIAVLFAGCSLFSTSSYGPAKVSEKYSHLEDAVMALGAPDIIGGNAKYMVVGWRRAEGLSIMGLFSSTNEVTHAAVYDANAKLVQDKFAMSIPSGSGLSILGPIFPLPSAVTLR